jgi:hypothetical protein
MDGSAPRLRRTGRGREGVALRTTGSRVTPRSRATGGIVMAFRAADGATLAGGPTRSAGDASDWRSGDNHPRGGRRSPLLPLEPRRAGRRRHRLDSGRRTVPVETRTGKADADLVWVVDLPRGPGRQSGEDGGLVAARDRRSLFTGTTAASGSLPQAPSLIAVDRATGSDLVRRLARREAPRRTVGVPPIGKFGGSRQLVFPAGDGWVTFDPATGATLSLRRGRGRRRGGPDRART